MITGGAAFLNKKITIPEADAIAACTLSKLQHSEPITDLTIIDEWNQCGHVNCVESKALRDHFNKLAEEGKR